MTRQYRSSPAAERDLENLAEYLAGEACLLTALRFYDAVDATFDQIALMPGIGERRATTSPPNGAKGFAG